MDDEAKEGKYKGRTPSNLRSAIKKGNTLPFVVVTDPTGAKPLLGFCATGNNSKSIKKLARNFKKKLLQNPDLLTEGVTPEKEDDYEDSTKRELLAENQDWSNSTGKTINAAVVSVSETHVTFLMKGDKEVHYPLAKLSAESRQKLTEL